MATKPSGSNCPVIQAGSLAAIRWTTYVIEFQCATCNELHKGMPTFGWSYPIQYLHVPEEERAQRCSLGSDDCVIDEELFFVRGCVEIPVEGTEEAFAWGAWVSLSQENFHIFIKHFGKSQRSHLEPMFGWLCSYIEAYPDTLNLKTKLHFRDDGIRPYIELEPTDHPLAVEQRRGISQARVAEIYGLMTHLGEDAAQHLSGPPLSTGNDVP